VHNGSDYALLGVRVYFTAGDVKKVQQIFKILLLGGAQKVADM